MKKIIPFLLLGCAVTSTSMAKQVDVETAKIVAGKFLSTGAGSFDFQDLVLQNPTGMGRSAEANSYYIFGLRDKPGFVVVSADDIVQPVLAYSFDRAFVVGEDASPEAAYWMGTYEEQILRLIAQGAQQSATIAGQWTKYLSEGTVAPQRATSIVSPLLTTTWNQGNYYNIYTPGTGSGKTPVGCVATAMAQIMKYWNYPSSGTGSYSYSMQTYGTLSADFANTSYNWSMMADNLTSSSLTNSKEAVSLLGYHCAIAVKMSFAPGGSGSQVIGPANGRHAANAFKNHFGYKSTLRGYSRDDFSENQWMGMLKDELDHSRPVLYAGFGQQGGHAFVFDGYDASNFFHVNWGWGGVSDGYFSINNLDPAALGIGGGGGGFNYYQQAIFGIEPNGPVVGLHDLELSMDDELTISANEIPKGDPFNVSLKVGNFSDLDYIGGFLRAEVYKKADSSYVTFFDRQQNRNFLISASESMTFQTNGISSLEPGEYFVKIGYIGLNNDWRYVTDRNGWSNHVDFSVTGPSAISDLSLSRSVSLSPNPARDNVTIDLSEIGQVNAIIVTNIEGKVIENLQKINDTKVQLSLNGWANGIYAVQILSPKGVAFKKLVVSH